MGYTAIMNKHSYRLITVACCALTAAVMAQLYRSGTLPLPLSTVPTAIDNDRQISGANTAITLLETQLAEELQLRQILEQENEWLQSLLDEQNNRASLAISPKTTPRDKGFDADKLRKLGLDDLDISSIEEVFNDLELRKIYLANEAQRGSWIRSKRFRDESRRLQRELRESLDDQQYDLLLYATGQNNRVEITRTLPNSPAESAGILAGDKIIQYGEQPIFSPKELHTATISGEVGELVAVTVQRNNEKLTVYLPRGPIGTRFRPSLSAPDSLDN